MTRPTLRPAERALGCTGTLIAVPTLAPMAAVVSALVRGERASPLVRRITFAVTIPLIVVFFLCSMILFLPYFIALQLLGRAGLVRLKMPASCTVTGEGPGFTRLSLIVPEDERETAARMLREIAAKLSAVAGFEPANLDHEIDRVTSLDYGRNTELRLRFSDEVTLEGEVYVDQGSFNADLTATFPTGMLVPLSAD